MKKLQVELLAELPEDIAETMLNEFVANEARHGIDVNYKTFALLLKDEKNQALGAINAYTAFSEIYIDDIWVSEAHQKQGLGRVLLESLEHQFKGQGFNNINLVTSSFQAPGFYEKCGFTLEFTRVNRVNPQLSKHFFVKFFDEVEQTQGLLAVE